VIATAGEVVADHAAAQGAGFTVGAGDSAGLAALLVELCAAPARLDRARARTTGVAEGWDYARTVSPLAAWCRDPRRARAGTPTITAPGGSGTIARARSLATRVQRALNSSTSAS
jgi:hypothetical protein